MEEIISAGGIGCFVKHSGAVPPSAEASGVDSTSQPGTQDDRSNELISSRTLKQDVTYRTGPGSQGNTHSELESGGNHDDSCEAKYTSRDTRWEFRRHDSHFSSSESGMDDQSLHSRSGSARSHRPDSKSRWTADSSRQCENDHHRRDRSSSQRYSESRERSHEDDGYERWSHSREYRGKSKGSY